MSEIKQKLRKYFSLKEQMDVLPHSNPTRASINKERNILGTWFKTNMKGGFLMKKFRERERKQKEEKGKHKKQKKTYEGGNESEEDENEEDEKEEDDEKEELQAEEEFFVHNWAPELEEDFFEPPDSPMVSCSNLTYTWHDVLVVKEQ